MESIIYYDLHTHQPSLRPKDIAIISIDLLNRERLPELFSNERYLSDKRASGCIEENNHAHLYSVGIHPWHADKSLITKVRNYATSPYVVAIGETGLDKIISDNPDDFKLQQELFTEHIQLSEEIGKPLVIHCVKAWDELLYIRKATKPSMPWIIHGFRGKAALATQLLNAGLYLSFGTFHNADALKAAWEKRRLLAETDDTNADIRTVYAQIAENLNITPEKLSDEIGVFFKANFFTAD